MGSIKRLTPAGLNSMVRDHARSAAAVDLVYVRDSEPGISRVRRGRGFSYLAGGRKVSDRAVLDRIRSLVIPPAWTGVWICLRENGHLQVTGMDARNRKQYKYHPAWTTVRSHTKFYHLLEFGRALPAIRQRLETDIRKTGLPLQKVLAAAVLTLQDTCIRIGSTLYEKLYGSFGLTTLQDRHVQISDKQVVFTFRGKKGVHHCISLNNRRLARIIRQCRDIPGKELFQYYDEHGQHQPVDSGMINQYIREISGGDFTAKDFRTWAGTLLAMQTLSELGHTHTVSGLRQHIIQATDRVAEALGNTRAVCRKYYIHPDVIRVYEEGLLDSPAIPCDPDGAWSADEMRLLHILENQGIPAIARVV